MSAQGRTTHARPSRYNNSAAFGPCKHANRAHCLGYWRYTKRPASSPFVHPKQIIMPSSTLHAKGEGTHPR